MGGDLGGLASGVGLSLRALDFESHHLTFSHFSLGLRDSKVFNRKPSLFPTLVLDLETQSFLI